MPSIKLGQLLSAANHFLGGAKGIGQNPKAAAVDLLKKNPLELDHSKSPTAHLTRNPLEFQHIQFPSDLGQDGGHYMIFYSISNNKSLGIDNKFYAKNKGLAYDSEDVGTTGKKGNKFRVGNLKKSKYGAEVVPGREAVNSVITGGLQTHSQVTGAVALYMPPGIKTTYAVSTGHTELGIAGQMAGTISRIMASEDTAGQVTEFLQGVGGAMLSSARKLAVGAAQSFGIEAGAAITKVTGTAENNFSEAVFEKVNEREFSYTFNLMARNKKEALDIQKIIKFFKYHMHPELDESTGGRYFRVPSEFEIHYAYNDQKNNFLHELSRCVLQNVTVDYGGDNFQTFRQFDNDGAAPVNISMTLSFIETTILTKQQIIDGF